MASDGCSEFIVPAGSVEITRVCRGIAL